MKHRRATRSLSRRSAPRRRLMENLTSALLQHGHVITTVAKAKELRRHVESLVTTAKQELTVHRRRLLLRKLAEASDLKRLVSVAQAAGSRPGGYTRITKVPAQRTDAAPMARVDFVDQISS